MGPGGVDYTRNSPTADDRSPDHYLQYIVFRLDSAYNILYEFQSGSLVFRDTPAARTACFLRLTVSHIVESQSLGIITWKRTIG